jgi:hypothetical protein
MRPTTGASLAHTVPAPLDVCESVEERHLWRFFYFFGLKYKKIKKPTSFGRLFESKEKTRIKQKEKEESTKKGKKNKKKK